MRFLEGAFAAAAFLADCFGIAGFPEPDVNLFAEPSFFEAGMVFPAPGFFGPVFLALFLAAVFAAAAAVFFDFAGRRDAGESDFTGFAAVLCDFFEPAFPEVRVAAARVFEGADLPDPTDALPDFFIVFFTGPLAARFLFFRPVFFAMVVLSLLQ